MVERCYNVLIKLNMRQQIAKITIDKNKIIGTESCSEADFKIYKENDKLFVKFPENWKLSWWTVNIGGTLTNPIEISGDLDSIIEITFFD